MIKFIYCVELLQRQFDIQEEPYIIQIYKIKSSFDSMFIRGDATNKCSLKFIKEQGHYGHFRLSSPSSKTYWFSNDYFNRIYPIATREVINAIKTREPRRQILFYAQSERSLVSFLKSLPIYMNTKTKRTLNINPYTTKQWNNLIFMIMETI